MGSLVLGTAGAAVGSQFATAAGGTYAALGWAIGSTLGNMLFQPDKPDIFGIRANDLQVQSSAYGNPIPILYGTARLGGNIIWATDLIETAHEDEGDGKGGGGGGSSTTYTYAANFALALCEGTIKSITKIWINGKLKYNGGALPSGFKVYTGSEDQLPDPTIEAYLGVGNTPAYRGMAYVVISNLQLEEYGNRIPTITFEVSMFSHEVTPEITAFEITTPDEFTTQASVYNPLLDEIWTVCWLTAPTVETEGYHVVRLDRETRAVVGYTLMGNYNDFYATRSFTLEALGEVWFWDGSRTFEVYDIQTAIRKRTVTHTTGYTFNYGTVDQFNSVVWLAGSPVTNPSYVAKMDLYTGAILQTFTTPVYSTWSMADTSGDLWWSDDWTGLPIDDCDIYHLDTITGIVTKHTLGSYSADNFIFMRGVYDPDRNSLWFLLDGSYYARSHIGEFNLNSLTLTLHPLGNDIEANYSIVFFQPLYDQARKLVIFPAYNIDSWEGVAGFSTETLTVEKMYFAPNSDYPDVAWGDQEYVVAGDELWTVLSGDTHAVVLYDLLTTSGDQTTLMGILQDVSIRCGLTINELEFNNISDIVDGLVLSQQYTGDNIIKQLQKAYFFDGMESNDTIKFVKIGSNTSIVTLTDDDLVVTNG